MFSEGSACPRGVCLRRGSAQTPLLTSSGGHCSGRYASWNAFLFRTCLYTTIGHPPTGSFPHLLLKRWTFFFFIAPETHCINKFNIDRGACSLTTSPTTHHLLWYRGPAPLPYTITAREPPQNLKVTNISNRIPNPEHRLGTRRLTSVRLLSVPSLYWRLFHNNIWKVMGSKTSCLHPVWSNGK